MMFVKCFQSMRSEFVFLGAILFMFFFTGCEQKKEQPNPSLKTNNSTYKTEGGKVNGKKHGFWRSFHPNGKIWSECTYKNGLKDGRIQVFHSNGTLHYTGEYKEDKKVKSWFFYNQKGKFMESKNYDTTSVNK